jgi:hypothetical protein
MPQAFRIGKQNSAFNHVFFFGAENVQYIYWGTLANFKGAQAKAWICARNCSYRYLLIFIKSWGDIIHSSQDQLHVCRSCCYTWLYIIVPAVHPCTSASAGFYSPYKEVWVYICSLLSMYICSLLSMCYCTCIYWSSSDKGVPAYADKVCNAAKGFPPFLCAKVLAKWWAEPGDCEPCLKESYLRREGNLSST